MDYFLNPEYGIPVGEDLEHYKKVLLNGMAFAFLWGAGGSSRSDTLNAVFNSLYPHGFC
jgi:hypothetical protein